MRLSLHDTGLKATCDLPTLFSRALLSLAWRLRGHRSCEYESHMPQDLCSHRARSWSPELQAFKPPGTPHTSSWLSLRASNTSHPSCKRGSRTTQDPMIAFLKVSSGQSCGESHEYRDIVRQAKLVAGTPMACRDLSPRETSLSQAASLLIGTESCHS